MGHQPGSELRKARTQLAVLGEQPTAWVLHPADVGAVDLLREGTNGGFLLRTPPDNVLGPLPVIESVAVPAGTAVLGDFRLLQLVVREDAKLDVDRSGERFEKNLARLRLEGRYCGAVLRTTAFASVDLAP